MDEVKGFAKLAEEFHTKSQLAGIRARALAQALDQLETELERGDLSQAHLHDAFDRLTDLQEVWCKEVQASRKLLEEATSQLFEELEVAHAKARLGRGQ